jgi:hypothetical protein
MKMKETGKLKLMNQRLMRGEEVGGREMNSK